MAQTSTPDVLPTPDRAAVRAFLATARAAECARLSGAPANSAATFAAVHDSVIVGYAQAVPAEDAYVIDCIAEDPAVRERLIVCTLAELSAGVGITWWGHENASDITIAASLGMHPPHRRLLNMTRPLPLDPAVGGTEVHVRPFVIGSDEEAWLQVNNAAFSWHGEQGDWDIAMLRTRMGEPWFDHEGLLLHERDGRLAAFCWTKVHELGLSEIYVIAVHPDFHGFGLGRALTIAGLRHLSKVGSTTAMLYVEADNTAAVRLYESLGFRTVHTDIAFNKPAFNKPAFNKPASNRPGADDTP
jgi:mycothiol synthase